MNGKFREVEADYKVGSNTQKDHETTDGLQQQRKEIATEGLQQQRGA